MIHIILSEVLLTILHLLMSELLLSTILHLLFLNSNFRDNTYSICEIKDSMFLPHIYTQASCVRCVYVFCVCGRLGFCFCVPTSVNMNVCFCVYVSISVLVNNFLP